MCKRCCWFRRTPLFLVALFVLAMGGSTLACSDDEGGPLDNQNGQTNQDNDATHQDNDATHQGNDATHQGNDATHQNNNGTTGPCENLECDQVACGSDTPATSLRGTVYIPSGELPLPNAYVYIPNDELDPLPDGASCLPCRNILSGDPLAQARTNHLGEFVLENIPAAEEVPLVIQAGKWRRTVTLTNIDECTINEIDDPEILRLPRNRDEGNMPRIAVTTGNSDALECLVDKVGVDISEFGVVGSGASIDLYAAGGATGFSSNVNEGANFPDGTQWWSDLDGIFDYDIVLFSCDWPSPEIEPGAAQVLQDFTETGGRVFMTDQQKSWLRDGTSDFQSVAQWQEFSNSTNRTAYLDTSFSEGEQMSEWMEAVGALTQPDDGFPAVELWDNIVSIDEDVARRWIYTLRQGVAEQDAYFDFHTPIGVDGGQQCGRVVYSDLHVAAASDAQPTGRFPDNCGDQSTTTPQERALIYMFFDIGGCIIPEDCTPFTCDELGVDCGVHLDGCGGEVNCGVCTGDGECAELGQTCLENSDCCSNMCGIGAGDDEGECIVG